MVAVVAIWRSLHILSIATSKESNLEGQSALLVKDLPVFRLSPLP